MRASHTFIVYLCLATLPLQGQTDQATLDRILSEVRALNEKVASLEKRIAEMEGNAPAPQAASVPAEVAAFVAANPPPKENKEKWYENLRIELRKADARASGEWVKPEAWSKIALKMKPEEVIAILGEPSFKKFSIRKDTDEIFHYEADLKGTGKLTKGEVRIYRNRVSKIVAPQF
jgi:outer membrane murein-binding lipoprotein Lpp